MRRGIFSDALGGIVPVVTFGEKLRRAIETDGRSRALIARSAGLKPSILNNYLNRGSAPMADAAFRLARALDLPIDWLLDDDADWPAPVAQKPMLENISEEDLMTELARRQRHAVLRGRKVLEQIKSVDWKSVASELYSAPLSAELSERLTQHLGQVWMMTSWYGSTWKAYDIEWHAAQHNAVMPGSDLPPAEVQIDTVRKQLGELSAGDKSLAAIERYIWLRADARAGKESAVEDHRRIGEELGVISPKVKTTTKT